MVKLYISLIDDQQQNEQLTAQLRSFEEVQKLKDSLEHLVKDLRLQNEEYQTSLNAIKEQNALKVSTLEAKIQDLESKNGSKVSNPGKRISPQRFRTTRHGRAATVTTSPVKASIEHEEKMQMINEERKAMDMIHRQMINDLNVEY